MPILLIFLLTAACLPVDWPPLGSPQTDAERADAVRASAALTAAAVLLPLAAAFALRTWVVRSLRHPDRRVAVAQGYARVRRVMFFVNIGAVVLAVLGLGWGWTVWEAFRIERHGRQVLAPFAELLVPLPYFLIVSGCWLIYYDAERALHRSTPFGRDRPFWSRAGFFLHHLRQLALLVGLPVGLFVAQQSVARLAPEVAGSDWYRVGSVAAVPVLIVLMPLLIKPLLGLHPLPPGPVRARIEATARRLGFRYSDLLVWPTRGGAANAMIVGLVPGIRYVIFTDRVLEEMPPDELDAVFGHEVGHARHGHIWFYALFLLLSMTTLAALLLLLDQFLTATVPAEAVERFKDYLRWLTVLPVAVAAGYIFLVFGFLSRRCERQADVFGCRAVSCADPGCTGHTEGTAYPPGGSGLCPTGIRTFARALERVGQMNGYGGPDEDGPRRSVRQTVRAVFGWLRAWQHSTMPRRVNFLLSLIDDPRKEPRFQRRVLLLRWGLVIGLTAALAALGQAVGWGELLKVL